MSSGPEQVEPYVNIVDVLLIAQKIRDVLAQHSKKDSSVVISVLELWNNGRPADGH